MRKVTIVIVLLLLLFTYLYFSNPDKVVVKRDAKIEGFVNNLRAIVHRDTFWKHQLLLAKKKYADNLVPVESMISEFREIDQQAIESKKISNESLKEFVSPEQYKAILLRDEADRIEELGEYRQIDEMNEIKRLQNLEECKVIIPIIELMINEKSIKLFIPKKIGHVNIPIDNITDIDGNTYLTVNIGSQVWMAENLKTTRYVDGSKIPLISDGKTWNYLQSPGYCWYNNDAASNRDVFGALYNWYTVNTGKLCPTGWHVPTSDEWTALTEYVIGGSDEKARLREIKITAYPFRSS